MASVVAGHTPPPFFKRGPAPVMRLALYLALSLLLVAADLRFALLSPLRQAVAAIFWPIQRALLLPVEGMQDASAYLAEIRQLKEENETLRARQLEQANLLLRQEHLAAENRRLRALLAMAERVEAPTQAAQILSATRDPFSRKVLLDRGAAHGIVEGQPVIDETGLVGQITRVLPLTSEATLITDKNMAVPVELARNGLRAVLAGAGGGVLELKFLPINADVEVGDHLVTSGLDGVYLPGLPVAEVTKIDREASSTFARIECAPLAGVERNGPVLVMGKLAATPPPNAEPAPERSSAKARKARSMRR
ncbi:MAG: rod shape-determining protein MreC [Rhodocyclaceae bacterium]|nr:rod shape-determining protein MreC [Rhodocyclaceae bacterium]